MLVSLKVAICWPMLKYLFISILAFVLFWKSQISTHMTAMSDLGDTLIIYGQDARTTLLKIWMVLMIFSTISAIIGRLVFLTQQI